MFSLSVPQILVLLGLGIVLTGPDKLPHVAATAARFLKQVREFGDNARNELRQELGPEFDHLSLQDLNPATFVRNNLLAERQELYELRDGLTEIVSDPLVPNDQHPVGASSAGKTPRFDPDAT